ncbi:hypothetical protein ANN_27137 [Periplaneta americana]|uniref:Mariner Mos1 transposase n=1 Tax=Periplaneta americana TaxID=6978 RepID=A0ABQ8RXB1_PERAM|nr:hypothetical protein ANN_27137 [Periplaneta americana]
MNSLQRFPLRIQETSFSEPYLFKRAPSCTFEHKTSLPWNMFQITRYYRFLFFFYFKVMSRRKVMATVFFDSEGFLLVDIIPHGTTISSDAYVATLKKLQARMSRVRRHREKQDVLLLHDNARSYVSHKTTDQIRKLG